MTTFNVHIYREMRLLFQDIKADSPQQAAESCRDFPEDAACGAAVDCDGETFAAVVDLQGDYDYSQSVTIDFEPERHRKAAAKLLAALRMAENYLADDLDEDDETEMRIFNAICEARAEANAAGIRAEPPAPALRASLEAILPYAESEAYSLDKHKDSPEAEAESERAWKAIEAAHAAIAATEAAGITPAPADIDIHALLAQRRQIAAIWGVEDVQAVRPDLNDEQAWEVLRQVGRRHDAEVGINWIVLECYADMLDDDAPDGDQPEEA